MCWLGKKKFTGDFTESSKEKSSALVALVSVPSRTSVVVICDNALKNSCPVAMDPVSAVLDTVVHQVDRLVICVDHLSHRHDEAGGLSGVANKSMIHRGSPGASSIKSRVSPCML